MPVPGLYRPHHTDCGEDDSLPQRHANCPRSWKARGCAEGHRFARGKAVKPPHPPRIRLRQHPVHLCPANSVPDHPGTGNTMPDVTRRPLWAVSPRQRRVPCPAASPRDTAPAILRQPAGAG